MQGAQLTKFATLIKSQNKRRLSFDNIVKLNQPNFRDYLRVIKQHNSDRPNSISTSRLTLLQNSRPKPSKPTSHYYTSRNQLMSMKQFILLMSQSEKKRRAQDRAQQRLKGSKLIERTQRRIQNQDVVNLRLTYSSARKIHNKIEQKRLNGF